MIANLTIDVAEDVPWCLEMPDGVHRATWTDTDDGGWLTCYVDSDEDDVPVHVIQRRASLDELRDGLVKPWRERAMFGAPICTICQDDTDILDDLSEVAADEPAR